MTDLALLVLVWVLGFIVGWCVGLGRRRPQEYHWIACRGEQGRPELLLIRGGRHD